MAQQIIYDPSRREAMAAAAGARGVAIGASLANAGQTIERLLFAAQRRRDIEKERKLSLMGTMVSKYGFTALGPDFTTQWENTTGVKFPRGPDGKPVVPQSDEEKIRAAVTPVVMKKLQEDPETAMVYAGLQKPPPSPEEQANKTRELDIKDRANTVRERNGALRYAAALAKASKDDMPSGFIYDKKTGELTQVGFEVPSLSNKQLANLDKVVRFNSQKLEAEYKQSQTDLARAKIQNTDPISSMIRTLAPRYSSFTSEDKKKFDALVQTWAETNDVDLPAAKPGLLKRGWNWLFTGPEAVQAQPKGGKIEPRPIPTQPPNRVQSMGDEELRGLLKQKLAEGMNPIDIVEQSGNDMRTMKMLSEMVR